MDGDRPALWRGVGEAPAPPPLRPPLYIPSTTLSPQLPGPPVGGAGSEDEMGGRVSELRAIGQQARRPARLSR